MSGQYGIQLDRAVDSLVIGERHRTDMGDLDGLAKSLSECGLLQPPTITPEGFVLIGARRVAAARLLGWRTISVWVRSGLSDRLGQLLSEHADHALHKPLTTLEAAALYRELKTILEEDAALRQAGSRFGSEERAARIHGGGDSPPPQSGGFGKAREQAARMVTGRDSHQMLERVNRIEDLAADDEASESIRAQARAELDLIRDGAGVLPSHQRMNAALSLDELDRIAADPAQSAVLRENARREAERTRQADLKAAEMERLAQAALERVKHDARSDRKLRPAPLPPTAVREEEVPKLRSARAFLATWSELDEWWRHYDTAQLARELTDEQLELFHAIAHGTLRFADELHAARIAVRAA